MNKLCNKLIIDHLGNRIGVNLRWSGKLFTSLVYALAINRPELRIRVEETVWWNKADISNALDFEDIPTIRYIALKRSDFKEYFRKVPNGFRHIKKIEVYFNKVVDLAALTDKSGTHTAVFVNASEYDIPLLSRQLSAVITSALPGVFKPGEISAEEEAMLIALSDNNIAEFNSIVNKIVENSGIENDAMIESINRYYDDINSKRVERCTNEIHDIESRINSYYKMVDDLCTQLEGLRDRLCGIKANQKNGQELIEYIRASSENVKFEGIEGDHLQISIVGNLTYFDPEYAEVIYKVWNFPQVEGFTKDDSKLLFKSIFMDETVKLKLGYTYTISNMTVEPKTYALSAEWNDFYPNPHLNEYRCLGSHGSVINRALHSGDVVAAIEQLVAATLNINLNDGVVTNSFIQSYVKSTRRCIALPDGREVAPNEAITWLKEQKHE